MPQRLLAGAERPFGAIAEEVEHGGALGRVSDPASFTARSGTMALAVSRNWSQPCRDPTRRASSTAPATAVESARRWRVIRPATPHSGGCFLDGVPRRLRVRSGEPRRLKPLDPGSLRRARVVPFQAPARSVRPGIARLNRVRCLAATARDHAPDRTPCSSRAQSRAVQIALENRCPDACTDGR